MTPEEACEKWANDFPWAKWSKLEKIDLVRTAWLEATRQAYEDAARIAESIWDDGLQGAHGGEQANRTAKAIRAKAKEYDNGEST